MTRPSRTNLPALLCTRITFMRVGRREGEGEGEGGREVGGREGRRVSSM